jgi:hypothetical protein
VVTVPVTGEVFETPEVLGRLAGFLRDLTEDLPAGEVYAAIDEQRDLPDHDERMDGVLGDRERFVAAWAAVTAGLPLPEAAWESVVLPAVVAFSTKASIKLHLELAASYWVKAEAAIGAITSGRTAMVTERPPEPELDALPSFATPLVGIGAAPAITEPRRRRRLLVLLLMTLLLLAAAAFVTWRALSAPAGRPSGVDSSDAKVVASTGATPSVAPSASPVAEVVLPPPPQKRPAPSPTWTGPGPAIAPGVPTALGLIKVTTSTIAFDWQAPADPGTGGIAYYRITLDGQDAGWTTETKATIGGLAPATTHTVTVLAVNGAGLTSAPSGPLTATTAALPTQQASPTPSATPQITVSPSGTIPLGDSFTVSGIGWICSAPGQVQVTLNGQLVAQRSTDPQGAFIAPVNIHADPDGTYYASVLGSGDRVAVTAGANSVGVQCDSLSQTITVDFY